MKQHLIAILAKAKTWFGKVVQKETVLALLAKVKVGFVRLAAKVNIAAVLSSRKIMIAIVAAAAVILLCAAIFLFRGDTPAVPTEPSSSSTPNSSTAATPTTEYIDTVGDVRIYQCDPKLAEAWQALAQRYTQETGVPVTVITPSGSHCETALAQYLQLRDAPTVFCLHHSHDLARWKAYCLELTGSTVVNALRQDTFALRYEDAVFGVASNLESYGIIYNSQLLARAGYTVSDITDYASLKNIVENITANKRSLGFSAFASPDLKDTAHGSLLCLLAGLSDDADVLRSFWDLYIANNIRSGAALTQSSHSDSLKDFLDGKAVFYLGGTWDYEALSGIEAYFLNILPVYTSESAADPGLHYSSSGYWCVNAQVSELDQAASLDFLGWLVTAQADSGAPVDSLGLLTPYLDAQAAGNPLEKLVLESLGKENFIDWNSCDALTPELLEQFGQALSAYTKSPGDDTWAAVAAYKQETDEKASRKR